MPVLNFEEADTLSPLGEFLAYLAHTRMKRDLVIGDVCNDRPNEHEGLRYADTGECFECHYKATYGVAPVLGLQTFMSPTSAPNNYRTFIGRIDYENDHSGHVCFGRTCERCGTNLRYEEGGNCVFCAGMRLAAEKGPQAMAEWSKQADHPIPATGIYDRFLRDVARAEGQGTYDGKVCSTHGTTERYSRNGRCVECVKDTNEEYYEYRKKKTAPEQTEAAGEFDNLFD